MEKTTREKLAKVAKDMAQVPFHGEVDGMASNLAPIVRLFPTWNLKEADGLWCAAFVYYCCTTAGFGIPYRPEECKTCNLAACLGWEEFATGDWRIEYHKGPEGYIPELSNDLSTNIFVRIFEFRMGIGIEKSDKFPFVEQLYFRIINDRQRKG